MANELTVDRPTYTLDEIVAGYLTIAKWHCDWDQPDLSRVNFKYGPDVLRKVEEFLLIFMTAHAEDCAYLEPREVGHYLFLARNGGGAGFRNLGIGEAGNNLEKAAEALGKSRLYIADDGLAYFS